jgi:hypothetical protein
VAKVKRSQPLEEDTWDLSLGAVQHTSRWGIIARAKGSTLEYYPGCPWGKKPKPPPWPTPTPRATRVAIWVGTRPFCSPPLPGTCNTGPSAYVYAIGVHGTFWGGILLDANAVCWRVKPPAGDPVVCWDPNYGAVYNITTWWRLPDNSCLYIRQTIPTRGGDPALTDSRMGSPGGLTLVGVWNRGVPPKDKVPWWLYPDAFGQVMPDCT